MCLQKRTSNIKNVTTDNPEQEPAEATKLTMKPELQPRIFPDLFGWTIESGLSLKRCTPSEPRESTVVTICRDPLASRFDGKSSEPGVLDEISSRPSLATEIYENVPVALARMHDRAGIRCQ